jgi:hypothetical protein
MLGPDVPLLTPFHPHHQFLLRRKVEHHIGVDVHCNPPICDEPSEVVGGNSQNVANADPRVFSLDEANVVDGHKHSGILVD